MADDETQGETADDAEAIDALNEPSDDLASEGGDADAEPDEADGESAPAPQPPPEDFAAPPGMSEKELEANHKKIDRARTTFYNRVSEIMGEDAQQMVECPACAYFVPGMIFPQEFPDQIKAELWPYLGLPDPNYYEDAPDRRQCPVCKGRTKVKTGSLDSVYALGQCRECGGKGYIDDLLPVQADARANGNAGPDALEPAPPMPEDPAWIEAARAAGYTIVPPFAQPHA